MSNNKASPVARTNSTVVSKTMSPAHAAGAADSPGSQFLGPHARDRPI